MKQEQVKKENETEYQAEEIPFFTEEPIEEIELPFT